VVQLLPIHPSKVPVSFEGCEAASLAWLIYVDLGCGNQLQRIQLQGLSGSKINEGWHPILWLVSLGVDPNKAINQEGFVEG